MTREEAIKVLKKMKYPYNCKARKLIISNVDRDNEALDMAIKALSQEPCDDAISRDAVIMECIKYADHEHNVRLKKEVSETRKHDAQVIIYACDYFKTFVEKLPPVTQKSGKWIERQNIERTDLETAVNLRWRYECSECGYEVRSKYHYCPNCGADMREEQTE